MAPMVAAPASQSGTVGDSGDDDSLPLFDDVSDVEV